MTQLPRELRVPKSHQTPGYETRELNSKHHLSYKTFTSSPCYIIQLFQRCIEINICTIKIAPYTNILLSGAAGVFSDHIHFVLIISATMPPAPSGTEFLMWPSGGWSSKLHLEIGAEFFVEAEECLCRPSSPRSPHGSTSTLSPQPWAHAMAAAWGRSAARNKDVWNHLCHH